MDLLNCDIASYWNDILANSNFISNLKCIENIEDAEEKLFSLLMRVLFLSVMGLKKEKDEAKKQYALLLNSLQSLERETVACGDNCGVKQKLYDCINKGDGMDKPINRKQTNFIPHSHIKCSLLNSRMEFKSNESIHSETPIKSPIKRKILAPETQHNNAIIEFTQKECMIPETIDYEATNMSVIEQEGVDILASPSLLGVIKRKTTHIHCQSPSEWLQPLAVKKKSPNLSKKCNKKNKRSFSSDSDFNLGVQNSSKRLKQTNISVDSFIKDINNITAADGYNVLQAISSVDEEERTRIQEAINASLATHECEMMMRAKTKKSPKIKTMKQRKRFTSPVSLKKEIDVENEKQNAMASVSRNIFNNNSSSNSVVKKSPLSLKRKSHKKSYTNTFSPQKSPSPMKYKSNSPRFIRMKVSDSKSSKIDEDTVLKALQNSSNDDFEKLIKKPLPKIKSFDNSFDYVGKASPKTNIVRKKCERKALQGWSCHECRDYYESRNLTEEEKKEAMNRCSRHRSKHNVILNTPSNFWNPEWTD